MTIDPAAIRRQFPIFTAHPEIAYLDGAATAQKPQTVIDALTRFLMAENANAYRGLYPLAAHATDVYDAARAAVAAFLHAASPSEIVFTKSCTESINLVARSLGEQWGEHDAVAVTMLEHHSNIIPWQQLSARQGTQLRWIDCDDAGHITMDSLKAVLADGKVRLVAVTAQSNVLGTRPPLTEIIRIAHAAGALVLIDAAQAVAHMPLDVGQLSCDFLAFSGHKLYGPTGIGVLYGTKKVLEAMEPFLGGGLMIQDVRTDGFTPADVPARFEAGSPPIAEAAGLHAAINWLTQYSWNDIAAHERTMITAMITALSGIDGVRILGPGTADEAHGCVSIVTDGAHPHDLADLLGQEGICVRAGHHCAQPLHRRLHIPASLRFSVSLHTIEEEIDRITPALTRALSVLRR